MNGSTNLFPIIMIIVIVCCISYLTCLSLSFMSGMYSNTTPSSPQSTPPSASSSAPSAPSPSETPVQKLVEMPYVEAETHVAVNVNVSGTWKPVSMTQNGSQLAINNLGTIQITDNNTNVLSISGITLLPGAVSITVSARTPTNITATSTSDQYNSNFVSDGKTGTLTVTVNPSQDSETIYVTTLQKN